MKNIFNFFSLLLNNLNFTFSPSYWHSSEMGCHKLMVFDILDIKIIQKVILKLENWEDIFGKKNLKKQWKSLEKIYIKNSKKILRIHFFWKQKLL